MPSNPGGDLEATNSHLYQTIKKLSQDIPALEDLTPAQIDLLASSLLADHYKLELAGKILDARINLEEELSAFLASYLSASTKSSYKSSIKRFFTWLETKNLKAVTLSPAMADKYIRDLSASRLDADSVRALVGAVSSFYTFLHRRHDAILNPFRGTKARPPSNWKPAVIPTKKEVNILLKAADPLLALAIWITSTTGLRIGGLESMQIGKNGSFTTVSKARPVIYPGALEKGILDRIRELKLNPKTPFNKTFMPKELLIQNTTGSVATILESRLTGLCRRLLEKKKISASYSFHDLRHYFSGNNLDKGIYWLCKHLGHSSVSITERYLYNSLGVDPTTLA